MDADWGGDVQHRRSVTGLVLKLAGGAIYYKTRFQPTIALSSTEAEFSAACDAGKAILYIRSILDQLGLSQKDATTLHIDNNGALNMANQQQPTKNTRHIDIKNYAIQDWVEKDLLFLRRISSTANYADALTKPLGRILHHGTSKANIYRLQCFRPGTKVFSYECTLNNVSERYAPRMGGCQCCTRRNETQHK